MQERFRIQEYHAKKKLMSCEGLGLSVSPYRTTQAKGRQLNVYKMLYQFHQERDDVLLSHQQKMLEWKYPLRQAVVVIIH